MKINIQSPGFAPTQELINFVQDKIKKLSCLYGEIIGSEVCLRLDNSDTKENKLCDIRLAIPGNDLMASAQCKTFEEAVLKAVEIIRRQIMEKKTKIIRTRNDISPQKQLLE